MSSHLILHLYFEDEVTKQPVDAPLVLPEAIDPLALAIALELDDQPQHISRVEVEYA